MTGQPPPGGPPDPRRRLNKTRNIIIGVIVVLTIFALIGACTARVARGGGIGGSARDYITQNYERDTSLDEGDVDAYVADGTPEQVAAEIRDAERPSDQRSGAAGAGRAGQGDGADRGAGPWGPAGDAAARELVALPGRLMP